jgi:hypothetical protein
MSIPNIGPELPDPDSQASDHSRKANPAPVYRDESPTDDVQAASTRASAVSHRFGGARSTLSRPPRQTEGGETDPHD